MSLLSAVVAALGSALFAALASVLHHRAGAQCGGVAVVTRPLWLWGTVVATAGVALHTVALGLGQLSVVQPLLVSGLLFALPMAAFFDRHSVGLVQLGWAGVVVAGLALFLASARPAVGRSVADPTILALASVLVLVVAGAAFALGRPSRRRRAALWAFAGGCGYGVGAALLKDSVGLLGLGVSEVVTSWVFYALLVVGAASIALNQAAFNSGPLAVSLPMLTIADPVVAVIVGAVVFGERTSLRAGTVGRSVAGILRHDRRGRGADAVGAGTGTGTGVTMQRRVDAGG